MKLNELDQYSAIIIGLLNKSAVKINKWREKFMLEVLLLYLIIPVRINFLQLGRYGDFGEQRYRGQFVRKFDWLTFNATLAESQISSRVAIAFDPSYISKSGKCTPYLGRFWSGCAKWLSMVLRSPVLVLLIWLFIPASIWRLFKLHL